jgi:hypothetical protein
MKRSLPFLSVSLWLATVCLGFCQGIFVRSAFYGRAGYGIDVTRQLQELAEEGGEMYVSNRTFGGDPLPGRRKFLTVTYVVEGRQLTQRVEENHTFRFQLPGPAYAGRRPPGMYEGRVVGREPDFAYSGDEVGRRIVRAVYGAHGRYVDVTEAVRSFASNGVKFKVANETFGIDPSKGNSKKLRVIYEENGETSEKSYDEGDEVRLR